MFDKSLSPLRFVPFLSYHFLIIWLPKNVSNIKLQNNNIQSHFSRYWTNGWMSRVVQVRSMRARNTCHCQLKIHFKKLCVSVYLCLCLCECVVSVLPSLRTKCKDWQSNSITMTFQLKCVTSEEGREEKRKEQINNSLCFTTSLLTSLSESE